MENQQTIITAYQEGAKKLIAQLTAWEIGSDEAHHLEIDARTMWYEDAENLGLSRSEAKKIWEKNVMEILISSDDPAFAE